MSFRAKCVAAAVLVGLVALSVIMFEVSDRAASSALSRGPRGWSLAREYVDQRGVSIEIGRVARPAGDGSGVLVLAFPWQVTAGSDDLDWIRAWLKTGGSLVVAYSGDLGGREERAVMDLLRLEVAELRPSPPLHPLAWLEYYGERWSLQAPVGIAVDVAEIEAPRQGPRPPREAEILLRERDRSLPLAFHYPFGGGRVVVLPASLFANSTVATAGNLDFLESLVSTLPPLWHFDEYHHGLVGPEVATEATVQSFGSWELFVGHLVVIYILGVVALGRPFGPAWSSTPVALASTRSFLRGIGALHRRLGHHQRAAELLSIRVASLGGNSTPKHHLGDTVSSGVRDDRTLVAAAAALAEVRSPIMISSHKPARK